MLLTIEDVKKTYTVGRKKKVILDSLNLEISSGEIVSITGKSGCGKTTLLNIIAGITVPEKGRVMIDGKKIIYFLDIMPARYRNREMGFIFQTFQLLPEETVLSNVLMPARICGKVNKETREYVDEILGKLKIYTLKNSKTAILSGGQKQRVALARALVNNPKIILADEPTANLDKKTSFEIFSILEELREEGKALLVITHKEYMHNISDKVYTLDKGILEET